MSENDERKFLHDISSPLGTLIFLVDILMSALEKKGGLAPEIAQTKQIGTELEKVRGMLQKRREILVARDESSKPN